MKKILSAVLLLCLSSAVPVFAQDETSRATQIEAVIAASTSEDFQYMESPDQAYAATVTLYPCVNVEGQEMAYERLDVIDLVSDEIHMVAEQLLNCGGLGAAGLMAMRWSPNSEFLYYTDAREGSPDGMTILWVPPVWRVHLADWQVDSLGQAQFSSDGKQLMSWMDDQVSVFSTDGADAADYPLLPADLHLIDIMWLPDLSGIIYVQTDQLMVGSRSTVTHLDLETMEQAVLLDTGD